MAVASKAARNEQRKLLATFLNNIAVALFLAAFLQPVLAVVQGQRLVAVAELLASSILISIGSVLLIAVQVVASWLED